MEIGMDSESWIIEIIKYYPNYIIIRIDISSIQSSKDILDNINFFLEDLIHDLNLDNNNIDLINS
jgi:hypothetical protein